MEKKNKTTAGFLAIFLGAFGVHYFYLGKTKRAITYLLISVFTVIGFFVFCIIGLVEGIRFFNMSEKAFDDFVNDIKQSPSQTKPSQMSRSDQYELLGKYKKLLDSGAITESEYTKVKNIILS